MIMLKASVTPSGTTGATETTATITPRVDGKLYAVYLDYASTVTSVTNVEIRLADPAIAAFKKENYNTDGWFFPRIRAVSETAAQYPLELSIGQMFPVFDHLTLYVSSSTPVTNAVTAYAFIEEG